MGRCSASGGAEGERRADSNWIPRSLDNQRGEVQLMATAEGFEGWAILEIMGHRQVAGYVRDVALFGARMARVDVPEVPATKERRYDYGAGRSVEVEIEAIPGFTHYYGGSAIFSCVPTTEELARAAAARLRTQPPQPLVPPSRQLAGHSVEDADFEEADDGSEEACEGCGAEATTSDDEGVPLCDACRDACVEDAGQAGQVVIFKKEKANGGGADAAAGSSSETSGEGNAPPPEAAV